MFSLQLFVCRAWATWIVLVFCQDHRAPADLCTSLPRSSFTVLKQNDEIRLSRGRHPLIEFALRYREFLAHLDERVAFPDLDRLEISTQRHARRRIEQRDNHASCVDFPMI